MSKWFLGNIDIEETISLMVRRMKSIDTQLGEIRELLEGLPLAIAAEQLKGKRK